MKPRHWFALFLLYTTGAVLLLAFGVFEGPARAFYLKAMGLFALFAAPVVIALYVSDVRAERKST